MLHNLNTLLAPAVLERLVLLVNHVLSREPEACERLRSHAGRVLRLELDQLPRLLQPGPPLSFVVTPAGLIEWSPEPRPADLLARLDAGNPAALVWQMLTGHRPALEIEGDVQLASDVDWLAKNLRWDIADELHRLFGPTVAGLLSRLGQALAQGLRGSFGVGSGRGFGGSAAAQGSNGLNGLNDRRRGR